MVGSREYGDGAIKISVADGGGSSRIFRKYVGDVPAHGVRAIEDEDAAAAHGLEIGGALHRANLADAQHGAGYRSFEPDGIGNEGPHVGMSLQNEGHALDHGGIGAFAALGEALLDEQGGIGEQCDALAGGALAAEIIGEALASGGLREHAGERVFTYAACAGEEQGVRDAAGAESSLEGADDAFVAEKIAEAHGLSLLLRGIAGSERLNRR